MGTTPTYSWPYPEATDPVANGAQDIEDLALAVESTVSGITGGKILQLVSAAKTDTFSTSVTVGNFTPVTGLSASITPSSTSSKILVMAFMNVASGSNVAAVSLRRAGTAIFQADASADHESTTGRVGAGATTLESVTIVYEDSPSSTSSLTYDVSVSADTSTTVYVNRSTTTGNAYDFRGASSITVMEVSA